MKIRTLLKTRNVSNPVHDFKSFTALKLAKVSKSITTLITFVAIGIGLTACNITPNNNSITNGAYSDSVKVDDELYAMDTYMTLTAYGENATNAIDIAKGEINHLESIWSIGNPDSEISRVNESGSGKVSKETIEIIKESINIYNDTDGAFDITIYPIMDIWGFTSGNYKVPTPMELADNLKYVGTDKIHLDEVKQLLTLEENVKLDLGGIAKGYTSNTIMDIFKESGVTSAMVSLGGNVQVLGCKPDGSSFNIAIKDPADDKEYLGVIHGRDLAIVTSGGYERNFTQNGIVYHHIIDPATARPAESGLKSVTIITPNGMLADAMSTSLFIMGKDRALEYWSKHRDEFDVVLLTEDGEIIITEGIKNIFDSKRDFIIYPDV